MRYLIYVFTITTLLIYISYSKAQDGFPPSVDEIFAEGIEVLDVEPVIDNAARKVYLYWDDSWHVYDYPAGFFSSDFEPKMAALEDGTYLLIEQAVDFVFRSWNLDPVSGDFEQVEAPCNSNSETLYRMETERLLHGGWVYLTDGVETYLCSMLSGELSEALPGEGVWGYDRYASTQPEVSADGQWLVLTFGSAVAPDYPFEIYSYEIATGELRLIGEFSGFGPELIYFGDWIDNRYFTISATDMPEWSTRAIWVGDVTQANSLREGASRWRFWPVINGTRFVFLPSEMEDGPYPGPCYEYYGDIVTGESNRYETGNLCDGGLLIPDGSGDRLYRDVYPDAALVRFNPVTGERRILYIGEIEQVGPVSPGGTYVVLGLGFNGVVETDQDPDINFGTFVEPDMHLIMELQTGLFIGEFPNTGIWYQDNSFLVDGNQLSSETLPGTVLYQLLSRNQFILQEDSGAVALYNPETGTLIPLLNGGFVYSFSYIPDDKLRLSVARSSEEKPSIWTIQLP